MTEVQTCGLPVYREREQREGDGERGWREGDGEKGVEREGWREGRWKERKSYGVGFPE